MVSSKSYEKREVTHGNSWGAFSKIEVSELGTVTFGKPAIFTGLRSTSFETSQDSTPSYADNQEHVRLYGTENTEGTITVLQFPKQFVLDHLGRKETSNGMLINTGKYTSFAWQYIETVTDEFGNEFEELNIYYNVRANAPTNASQTDEESAEAKEFEIPVIATPNNGVVDEEGKPVTHARLRKTEANAALFDLAYEQVILPDTPIPVTKPVVEG